VLGLLTEHSIVYEVEGAGKPSRMPMRRRRRWFGWGAPWKGAGSRRAGFAP